MKKILSVLLTVAMLFTLATPALAAAEAMKPFAVTEDVSGSVVILHSNDVHGAIEGYGAMATLRTMYEEAGAEVIAVDAGDFIQGDTAVSFDKGASAIRAMNLAGYDLAVPGNHELDYGAENLKTLSEQAEFPLISANVVDEDGKPYFEATKMIETESGKKIGFFGLTTPETAVKAHPAKIQGLKFQSGEELYKSAEASVDSLKKEGAELIVCVGHLGVDSESGVSAARSIDVLENVSGIDLFIDGHSHSTLAQIAEKTDESRTVNGAVLTSTGTKFENVGAATVKDGKVQSTVCIPTASVVVEKSNGAAAFAAEVRAEIEKEYGAEFASTEVALDGERANIRTGETNLGDLVANAMLWGATKDGELQVDADHLVAVINSGSIRASINAGKITKKDINAVLPFGNTLSVCYVSGAELLEALEAATFCAPNATAAFPQVAGMRLTVDSSAAYAQGEAYEGSTYYAPASVKRVAITSVNGKPFDTQATYGVVTNDFLAAGGDAYHALAGAKTVVNTGMPVDEIVMDYITEQLGGNVTAAAYGRPAGYISVKYVGVDGTKWYANAARSVMDKGVMVSTGNGFSPTGTVTRATVFQTVYNMEGRPQAADASNFGDIGGKWYAPAAKWAGQNGIASGTQFNGDRTATRAEIVTILFRYAQASGMDTSSGVTLSGYTDAAQMGTWAQPAFSWAVAKGIISGTSETTLSPNRTATRAELAQMLVNYIDGYSVVPALMGETTYISKYGNISTTISLDTVAAAGFEVGDMLRVTIDGQDKALLLPYGTGFSNVDQGSPLALADTSTNCLAFAINRGDFATTYGLGAKDENGVFAVNSDVKIHVSLEEKGGYLNEMEIRDLDAKRTDNREDYASDEVFANFREVTVGGIAQGVLYRTSSPVNPKLGRNTYADALVKKAGVKTVINLADTAESAAEYEGFDSSYYATLDKNGGVTYLNMGVDMYSDAAKAGLKSALVFMAEHKGPYAIHCNEGKDRAGYFAFLLEALMGADVDEIIADYMLSYENYYFVKKDSEQWTRVAESNIVKDIMKLAGVTERSALETVDLKAAAEQYVTETLGLSAEQLSAVQANLAAK